MPLKLLTIYLFVWPHLVLVVVCRFFNLRWGIRDLVPWPGIEPGPPALGTQSLSHWTTREVPRSLRIFGAGKLFFFGKGYPFECKWAMKRKSMTDLKIISQTCIHHWWECMCKEQVLIPLNHIEFMHKWTYEWLVHKQKHTGTVTWSDNWLSNFTKRYGLVDPMSILPFVKTWFFKVEV